MTVEEWENWVFDHGASGKAIRHAISEFASAALRERDAAHEIALKKARADALDAAARVADAEWRELFGGSALDLDLDRRMRARADEAKAIAARIRALLEEAGK